MSNEVAEQKKTFSMALTEKLTEVSGALPKDFNRDRFVQNSLALLNDNEKLRNFPPQQLMQGLLKGSYLGCDFFSQECYLIPYSGKLEFQLGYKGEVKIAKKYSTRPIKEIYAKVVRQGDEFQEKIIDGRPSIDFKPLPFNGGEIIGAFAVCIYTDDSMIYETMSIAEIEQARKQGMGNTPSWKNWYSEMARKVVLKRLCKHIPIDMENPTQMDVYQHDMEIKIDDEKPPVVDALAEDNIVDTDYTESEVEE
jgi:recombination protein RecT